MPTGVRPSPCQGGEGGPGARVQRGQAHGRYHDGRRRGHVRQGSPVGERYGDDRGEGGTGEGWPGTPGFGHDVAADVVVEHVEPGLVRVVGHDLTLRPGMRSRVTRYT